MVDYVFGTVFSEPPPSFLQTSLLNQRAFIVSQMRSIGLRSGEYGGKYIGCQLCQVVVLRY